MKAVMVMFDSLNRRFLSSYGCDFTHTPNFKRLSEKTATFDKSFIGSMPCMPARRELHTGRLNFLHRRWGPVEAFDDSMPEILKENGIYTHLISDHYHYWEDGGGTYHNRYSSWECVRGQEGDPWKGDLGYEAPENKNGRADWGRRDFVNREYMKEEKDHPMAQTFSLGFDFLNKNKGKDNWFLTIEAFDPHEPYFVPQKYRDLYKHNYNGEIFDWPFYNKVTETPEEIEHLRKEYSALVSMCDNYIGKVLDYFDKHDLWKDTMLIVNTDHGFLLSEHGWWGKNIQHFYNEVANTPLFIHDPRIPEADGQRRNALVTTIDLAPTLLDYFNTPIPKDMQGAVLYDTIKSDKKVHDAVLYGIHGGTVNITDGKYTYFRAPAEEHKGEIYNYTMTTTVMRGFLAHNELLTTEFAPPFSFTKDLPVMKIKRVNNPYSPALKTELYDIEKDYLQLNPIDNPEAEKRLIKQMVYIMKENDAPKEQYLRLGLNDE